MIFCHNCERNVLSIPSQVKCSRCGSQAVEFVNQHQQQPQHSEFESINQSPLNSMMRNLFADFMGGSQSSQFIQLGPSTIIQPQIMNYRYIIINVENQEEKEPVPQEIVKKFPETKIEEQCAICQQGGNQGIQLPCKHQFHKHCIKPWFENKNTCPCCRTKF